MSFNNAEGDRSLSPAPAWGSSARAISPGPVSSRDMALASKGSAGPDISRGRSPMRSPGSSSIDVPTKDLPPQSPMRARPSSPLPEDEGSVSSRSTFSSPQKKTEGDLASLSDSVRSFLSASGSACSVHSHDSNEWGDESFPMTVSGVDCTNWEYLLLFSAP
jgi:hypothetical protein